MSAVRQFENHEDGPGKKAGVVRIALAGNPNSGKTTVFNGYTGARQHVGNYPGVTVDRKEGHITVEGTPVTVVDLPGTYSLTAYSQEELVARRELSAGHVQAVIDVVDASALERNLLLTVQMLEMGIPVVLCCNMMDEARAAGIHIDMEHLGKLLGIPVLPMVARSGEGLQAAMKTAIALAREGKREPLRFSYGSDLDPVIADMEKRIAESGLLTNRHLPSWVALKMLEGDSEIWHEARLSDAHITAELEDICKKTAAHVRDTLNANLESIITNYRYGYIRSLLRDGIVRQDAGKDRLALSDKLDKVLTNAFFGPLIMIGVLYLMFQVTFELGAYPQGWVEDGFTWLGDAITAALPEGLAQSLIVDGIIAGVGGVLSFVPLILIMFVLISFMEDSGYMARVAYMMDRIFRFFGLHGASVMPYIIAGGIAGGAAPSPGAMASPHPAQPQGKAGHPAYPAVHGLRRQTAGIFAAGRGFFPGQRGHRHVFADPFRLGCRLGCGALPALHHRQGRGHAFCHGTAPLPYAHALWPAAALLGARLDVHQEGGHHPGGRGRTHLGRHDFPQPARRQGCPL